MTAIAGIWRFDGKQDADDVCARMLSAQQIYGLHDASQWSDGSIAVGRRLMRLLPEDDFDRQPLVGGGGRYVLVADIRLDNRGELSKALEIPAEETRTTCDAAVLLAAVERWGEACLERLVGDFAFALWDKADRRMLLARDPLGQRPLHYHRGSRFFAFATMPKGLHALPEIPYAPDEERIAETLALLPETGPRSFFKGVERVELGHVVGVTAERLSTRRYWQPKRRTLRYRNPDDYSDEMREILDEAVRCRLRSVGKVATYLSGGLDSGAVTATVARLLAPSGKRVTAFTSVPRKGYEGPAPWDRIVDEGPLAAATAALYPNIDHIVVPNEGRSPIVDLDRSFYLYDRPVNGIFAAGWSNSLDKALAKHNVKVVLGGETGNLTLTYDGMELLSELFRSGRWLRLFLEYRGLVREGRMHWRGAVRHTLAPWFPLETWLWIHKLARKDVVELHDYSAISPRRFAELDPVRTKTHDFSYRRGKSGFDQRLWELERVDPGNYRKGGLAGWQVDVRDPTADIRLTEFSLAIPTEQFLHEGVSRALARRTLADRLPRAVLEEPRRGMLAADWHEDVSAARREVAEELDRIGACPTAARAIDLPRLYSMMAKWPTGQWHQADVATSYHYAMQRAIAIGHFMRRATRSNA